jgi:hypothetical protein
VVVPAKGILGQFLQVKLAVLLMKLQYQIMNLRGILALEVGAGLLLAKGKILFVLKLAQENIQVK